MRKGKSNRSCQSMRTMTMTMTRARRMRTRRRMMMRTRMTVMMRWTPNWKHTLRGSIATTRTGKKNCGTRSKNTGKTTTTRGSSCLMQTWENSRLRSCEQIARNGPDRSCSTGPAVMVAGTNRDAKSVKPAWSPASRKSIQCRRRRNSTGRGTTGRGSAGVEKIMKTRMMKTRMMNTRMMKKRRTRRTRMARRTRMVLDEDEFK
mmetsp:Transcript_5784/g.21895  ORF Transcript_5784/g.21895 Transcript_5784/m.21895 type:complete len:204 (+) Transcript_5784:386-997(+)